MCLEPVAVSTQGLKVGWVIVKAVTVYVVYVQLADVYWLEVAVLAVVLLVDCVWVLALDDVASVNREAPVSTGSRRHSTVSEFDFNRATD